MVKTNQIYSAVINLEIYQNDGESGEDFEERIDETLRYVSEHVDTFKIVDGNIW